MFSAATACFAATSLACTSAIIAGRCTPDGRPLLWKNRDTSCLQNFVDTVAPTADGSLGYVALFNAGDSLRREAWAGVNRESFAIMNTASYNLVPDTARIRDREGLLMSRALACCRTLDDFERLLDTLPRPLGVQANFGVIDTNGRAAFYETCDTGFVCFSLDEAEDGVLIRTNFSISGNDGAGFGYIRYDNASHLIRPVAARRKITPAFLTDTVSCSYYHSLLGQDALAGNQRWIIDQDYIPRHSTSASIVITGKSGPDDKSPPVMRCALGYPPCASAIDATPQYVPEQLRPDPDTGLAPACTKAMKLKNRVFPIKRGSGSHYIDTKTLKEIIQSK